MARTFNNSTANRLFIDGWTGVTGFPCTLACWFNHDGSSSAEDWLLEINTGGTGNHFINIHHYFAGNELRVQSRAGVAGTLRTSSTGPISANTWYHAAGTFSGGGDVIAYLNGSAGSAATGATAPTLGSGGVDIGTSRGTYNAHAGDIAECAIWNDVLSAGELNSLAAGVSPLRVRPSALKGYWPLPANETNAADYAKGNNLTLVGALAGAAHAPVGPMFGFDEPSILAAPAAAGNNMAIIRQQYERHL